MRLTDKQIQIIKQESEKIFGDDAQVWVFGSRVDDNARGGDIDLLIQLDKPDSQKRRKSLQVVAKLQILLGDQPIDVLVLDPLMKRQPIHEEAMRSGIKL